MNNINLKTLHLNENYKAITIDDLLDNCSSEDVSIASKLDVVIDSIMKNIDIANKPKKPSLFELPTKISDKTLLYKLRDELNDYHHDVDVYLTNSYEYTKYNKISIEIRHHLQVIIEDYVVNVLCSLSNVPDKYKENLVNKARSAAGDNNYGRYYNSLYNELNCLLEIFDSK